jgi:hypothetical protein
MANYDLNALYAAQAANDNASRKTMIYQLDNGNLVLVEIEENIGEIFAFEDWTGAETVFNAGELYKRFEMRKIHYTDGDNISGSFPVGTPIFSAFTDGGTITLPRKGKAAGVTVTITGTTGEKKTFRSPNDTGQLSGNPS